MSMNGTNVIPSGIEMETCQMNASLSSTGRPLKIVDRSRSNRQGIFVSSLEDLKKKAQKKLAIDLNYLKIVLECDGTMVEDEEYFQSLESQTVFMVLGKDEHWVSDFPSERESSRDIALDEELKDLKDKFDKLNKRCCKVYLGEANRIRKFMQNVSEQTRLSFQQQFNLSDEEFGKFMDKLLSYVEARDAECHINFQDVTSFDTDEVREAYDTLNYPKSDFY